MRRVTVLLIALSAAAMVACSATAPTSGGLASPSGAAAAEVSATPASEATPAIPSAPATASVLPTITVTAVGDMLFDSAPKRLIQAKGGRAPFTALASRLRAADVTVGNLECPLSTRGRPVAGKTFTFQGDPRAAEGLVWAGFDLLSLANNHARDYGETALRDTFKILGKSGLAFAGAGVDRAAAWRPVIIERGGARIAYLAFSEITPVDFAATSSRPGTAYTQSISAVLKAIKAAHKKADYVIVSFHWGTEGKHAPTARQVSEGRAAVRAGADMVLSHHPHVVQGVEFYRRGIIAYSLGNFVFSPGSDSGRDTMLLHASMGPKGITGVSIEPVWVSHSGRPIRPTGSAARRILDIVKTTSRGRGTHVRISGASALLTP